MRQETVFPETEKRIFLKRLLRNWLVVLRVRLKQHLYI